MKIQQTLTETGVEGIILLACMLYPTDLFLNQKQLKITFSAPKTTNNLYSCVC
jgi:hypothetical protein